MFKNPQTINILKTQTSSNPKNPNANKNANKHPENPQILDILIQTIKIPKNQTQINILILTII
jgi:hypothetical protein